MRDQRDQRILEHSNGNKPLNHVECCLGIYFKNDINWRINY